MLHNVGPGSKTNREFAVLLEDWFGDHSPWRLSGQHHVSSGVAGDVTLVNAPKMPPQRE